MAQSDLARLDAMVRGSVQGVGFRFFVVNRASALGLVGWVANEADGSVRCVAEGPRPDLERLLDELRDGPPAAAVERVETSWQQATGAFDRFSVRSGAHRGD
ncbi:MAG TPA: acylphosphatase [Candidatus Limnocylindrales bacterium]